MALSSYLLSPEDFPPLIQVNGVTYHILFPKRLPGGVLGMCDDDLKLILISRDQPADELNATFWHELQHAWEKEYRINLGHAIIRKQEWAILDMLRQLFKAR